MHPEAYEFVRHTLATLPRRKSVIEIGSRDINGTVRDLLGRAEYVGIDLHEGPNVDVVADAVGFEPEEPVDTVLCLEVLEHAHEPAKLCKAAHGWLKDKGYFLITAATEGRPPHSGIDGGALRENEPYRPIAERDLRSWLRGFKEVRIEVNAAARDIYAKAVK